MQAYDLDREDSRNIIVLQLHPFTGRERIQSDCGCGVSLFSWQEIRSRALLGGCFSLSSNLSYSTSHSLPHNLSTSAHPYKASYFICWAKLCSITSLKLCFLSWKSISTSFLCGPKKLPVSLFLFSFRSPINPPQPVSLPCPENIFLNIHFRSFSSIVATMWPTVIKIKVRLHEWMIFHTVFYMLTTTYVSSMLLSAAAVATDLTFAYMNTLYSHSQSQRVSWPKFLYVYRLQYTPNSSSSSLWLLHFIFNLDLTCPSLAALQSYCWLLLRIIATVIIISKSISWIKCP